MTDLYLIAHKVRGQPTFDIAQKMQCAVCHADPDVVNFTVPPKDECHECDSLGFWWIIPTSGYRAYPYWSYSLKRVFNVMFLVDKPPSIMPTSLPDHYAANDRQLSEPAAQKAEGKGLLAKLGLIRKATPFTDRRV